METCRRLDGLPLALEIAAARVRGLALEIAAARVRGLALVALRDRLERALPLLIEAPGSARASPLPARDDRLEPRSAVA